MKVNYKKSIIEQIGEAKEDAEVQSKSIESIELNSEEWVQLHKEAGSLIRHCQDASDLPDTHILIGGVPVARKPHDFKSGKLRRGFL